MSAPSGDEEATDTRPPPHQVAVATYLIREAVAVLFVLAWLLLFAGELLTGAYHVPFWFHGIAVAVLGYALGLSVADLTRYRPRGRG